jgi:hypothetical protein
VVSIRVEPTTCTCKESKRYVKVFKNLQSRDSLLKDKLFLCAILLSFTSQNIALQKHMIFNNLTQA